MIISTDYVVVAGRTEAVVIVMCCVALVTIISDVEEMKNMYSYHVTNIHNCECINLYYLIFVVSECILSL